MEFNYIPNACFIVVIYLIAELLKLLVFKTDTQKKAIPYVCGLLGAVAAAVLYYVAPDLIGGANVLDAIGIGVVSGLCATGANQLYKQIKSGAKDITSN